MFTDGVRRDIHDVRQAYLNLLYAWAPCRYMVDASERDAEKVEQSKTELHQLVEKPQLACTSVVILGAILLVDRLLFDTVDPRYQLRIGCVA
jgi:hypothetical protein